MPDQNDVPTKPLPVVADAVPTEPLAADPLAADPLAAQTVPIAAPPAPTTIPRDRSWVAPLVIGVGLVLLLILGVAVLPRLLAGEVAPAPITTPTVEAPTEEAPPPVEGEPEPEAPPVVPIPEPTEIVPQPTEEPPVEPSPTATP